MLLIGPFKGYHMTLVGKWRLILFNKAFGTMIIGIDQNWWMDQTDHISAQTYDWITQSCTPCSWFEHCTLSRSTNIDAPYCCCLLCHLAWSYTNDYLCPKYDVKLPTFILGTDVKLHQSCAQYDIKLFGTLHWTWFLATYLRWAWTLTTSCLLPWILA